MGFGAGEISPPSLGIPIYTPQDIPPIQDTEARPIRDPDPLEMELPIPPLFQREMEASLDGEVQTPPPPPPEVMEEEDPPRPGPSNAPDPPRPSRSRSVKRSREGEEGEGEGMGEEFPPPRRKSRPRVEEGGSPVKPIVPEPSTGLGKVFKEIGEKVKGWADTAVALSQESDEEMQQLNQIFSPLSLGVKPPHYLNGRGTFTCYAPNQISIPPGETKRVSTQLYGLMPEGKVCTLFAPAALAKQGGSLYPSFMNQDHCLSVLVNNSSDQHIRLNHGASLAKGSWSNYAF